MTATASGSVRSAAWIVVLGGGMAAAVVAALLPAGSLGAATVMVAAQGFSLVAVIWRFRATPPQPALPWIVFFVGVALSAVADAASSAMGQPMRWAASQPALDLLHVVSYGMLAAGIALAARSRGAGRDPAEIVDALIVTATAGVAVFALLLGTHVPGGAGTPERAAAFAVVLLDVVMLGLGTLVFIRLGRLTGAMALLAGALVANLLADTLYADGVLGEMALPSQGAVSFAILASICFAAAMLHPAIPDLLRVRPAVTPLSARLRLELLTVMALVAAVVALAGQFFGEDATVDVATDVLVLVIVALFAIRAWMLATAAERQGAALARTQTDLARSSALLAGISDAMPGAVFAGDLATQTLDYASPGLRTLLGMDPASAIGRPGWIVERTHPDDRRVFMARSQAARSAGSAFVSHENRMRTEDGSYRHIASTVRYVQGPDGNRNRFVGVGIDVSDRVAAEDALRASHDLVEQIVATSPGIMFRGRLVPRVLDFVSAGVETLLGYSPDEIVGVEDWIPTHMHPEDAGPQLEAVRILAQQGGGEDTRVVRIRAADGSYRALLATFRVRVDADNQPEYFASAIDVTEQQEVDARLREREAFVADILQTSPAVIFAGRADTDTVEFVSASVEQVLGYAPDEVVGVPGFVWERVHPDDVALMRAEHRPGVTTGLVDVGEVRRFRRKDGAYSFLTMATHVSTDVTGVRRFVSSAMDITDRIALEGELVAARERAEDASRAKMEFLSLVSHELRTPLNAILGFGELLDRADLAGEDRESVTYIIEAGRNLLRLIDRILDYVRLESGRLNLEVGAIIPAQIVRLAVSHVTALAVERGVTIDDRTGPFADLVCSGDGRRLGTIVEGLLDNAIHHGGPGVTISVSLLPTEDGGSRIVVADDGVGMTDEQATDALSPLSRNGIGTGVAIGLSLARRLAEAMGGTLAIGSRPGSGTTVWVTLPAFVEDAPVEPAVEGATAGGRGAR